MRPSSKPNQKGAFDADQAEVRAIRVGATSISAGIQDELLSGEAEDAAVEPPFNLPDFEREQSGAESLAGSALEVANERKRILGARYTFDVDRAAINHKGGNWFYDYLLVTSVAASQSPTEFKFLVRQFERVVCDLLVAFAGGDARGLRVGWPTEKGLDVMVQKTTSTRIAYLKNHCGFDEDEWTLDPSKKVDVIRKKAKDARIDVVVRRSLGDSRVGGFSILAQCGCGKNDVDESSRKHQDLSTAWLDFFFGRTTVPPPFHVFATSQHIVRNEDLFQKQSEAKALIFDRIRLCLLADEFPKVIAPHKPRIKSLTSAFFKSTLAI